MERGNKHITVDRIVSSGYDIEIVNSSNLEILNRDQQNPVVLFSNHASADDPLLMYMILYRSSPDSLKNLIVPISEHHAQFKNFPAYALAVKSARKLGIIMPEIVQSYRIKGASINGPANDKSLSLNRELNRLLLESLPKGARVAIWPEGHRSEDASLLPAEAGIGFMVQLMQKLRHAGKIENGYFIPTCSQYSGETRTFNYNLFNKPHVSVDIGSVLTLDKVIDECSSFTNWREQTKSDQSKITSHILMHHVAEMLPPERQGFYSPEYYADTLAGRYEQRLDDNGKVFIFDNWAEL